LCPASAASASFGADAPYAPCGALYHGPVKKKSTFQLRKLPPDLLGRVNAYVELLGVDREKFFEELLDDLTKELRPVQEKIRKGNEARKAKLRTD
jgi:hypothetical protein